MVVVVEVVVEVEVVVFWVDVVVSRIDVVAADVLVLLVVEYEVEVLVGAASVNISENLTLFASDASASLIVDKDELSVEISCLSV